MQEEAKLVGPKAVATRLVRPQIQLQLFDPILPVPAAVVERPAGLRFIQGWGQARADVPARVFAFGQDFDFARYGPRPVPTPGLVLKLAEDPDPAGVGVGRLGPRGVFFPGLDPPRLGGPQERRVAG